MKLRLSFLSLCLMAFSAIAGQNHLNVSYTVTKPSVSDTVSKPVITKMTLISDGSHSLFFNETSLYCDSMTSTPEGKKKLTEMQMAAWMTQDANGGITIDTRRGNVPRKKVHLYVVKDFAAGQSRVYNSWGDEKGYYDEPFSEIDWQLSDSTLTILGQECNMATADYHGRQWTAWFATEIPSQDGPWKFCGLPGLILKAESGPFVFEATNVAITDAAVPSVYSTSTYSKVDRRKALASDEHYYNNSQSILKARFGNSVKFQDNGKEEPKFDAQTHALEPDYR